jgi:uncharacterized protein (DUF2062 family)
MFAYLDPAAGGLIASAVVAGLAGVSVVFRMGWRRFLSFFSKSRREQLRAEKADRVAAADSRQETASSRAS